MKQALTTGLTKYLSYYLKHIQDLLWCQSLIRRSLVVFVTSNPMFTNPEFNWEKALCIEALAFTVRSAFLLTAPGSARTPFITSNQCRLTFNLYSMMLNTLAYSYISMDFYSVIFRLNLVPQNPLICNGRYKRRPILND